MPLVGNLDQGILDGDDWSAVEIDAVEAYVSDLPRGIVGRTVATASSYTNATTSYTDITATSGTAPSLSLALDTGRLYRAVYYAMMASSVATDRFLIAFHFNGGAEAMRGSFLAGSTSDAHRRLEYVFQAPTSSTATYKVQTRLIAGATGTISMTTASTNPVVFYIEDLGKV